MKLQSIPRYLEYLFQSSIWEFRRVPEKIIKLKIHNFKTFEITDNLEKLALALMENLKNGSI